MRLILFTFATFVLFLTNCKKHDTTTIQVRFDNGTALNLDDTYIASGNIPVGDIPAGFVTDYILFDQFLATSGAPAEILKVHADGQELTLSSPGWCGTESVIRDLEPGYYTVEIMDMGPDADIFWGERYVLVFKK